MVRVELYQAGPGELIGFRAVGHAGYAPPGEDIVCAGVSALTQACVLGLKDHLKLPVVLKAEHGLLECRLPREIPPEARAPAQAILETMVLALREIEKEHGRYFALISLDAPRPSRQRRSRRGRRSESRPERASQEPAGAEAAPAEAEVEPAKPEVADEAADEAPAEAPAQEGAVQEPVARSRPARRRRGTRRRKAEPAAVLREEPEPEHPEASPPEPAAEEVGAQPEPPVPAEPEPEPEQQVAVAEDPVEKQVRAIIHPFRRRVRSFRPGRLGRRWRP